VLSLVCAAALGQQNLKLNALFSDGAILQENASDPIFGSAAPESTVRVNFEGKDYVTQAKPSGAWQVNVPVGPAGPAFSFEVSSGNEQVTVKGARAGEVWLASGQSNMEFMEIQADDYDLAKQQADPNVCMFNVKKTTAETPLHQVQGVWESSSAANISHFSAVGLAFAREVSNRLQVPVGIINASWGGTPAEAWMSQEALTADPVTKPIYDKYLADLRYYPSRKSAYDLAMQMWLTGKSGADNQGFQNGWVLNVFNDSDWKTVEAGQDANQILKRNFLGSVWYRKVVNVPDEWYGQPLNLSLGNLAAYDITYFNGVRVGITTRANTDPAQQSREYRIAPGLVHKGPNLIAVRVFNADGPPGMEGPADMMRLSLSDETATVPLNGDWKFNVEQELDPETPRPHLPNGPGNPTSPAELFNGMIAPLIPYRIKGAIWYQGESNVGNSDVYRHLFPNLIQDWRSRWPQTDLPFYYVQLANYNPVQTEPGDSSWANIREIQAKAMGLPRTGMAVSIDLGSPDDIHPKNKREIGKRLALWALGNTYQIPVLYASPFFRSMQIVDSRVLVTFSNGSLATTDDKPPKGFEVAGADHKFFRADARVSGSVVTVSAPEVLHPVAVRYAWADNPDVNLVNRIGLPAAPFRTDDFPLHENVK
jgi:sialate O-acetylesterase